MKLGLNRIMEIRNEYHTGAIGMINLNHIHLQIIYEIYYLYDNLRFSIVKSCIEKMKPANIYWGVHYE